MILRRFPSFILISMFVMPALAQPAADHPAKAQLLADVSAIKPDEPFTAGIRFTMQPHWHVYWVNPGDSGQAPAVQWKLPQGFTISDLQFPVPKKFDQVGGLVGYGYEDEVLLTATVTPPKDLPRGQSVTLRGDASWLVCDPNVCIPGDTELSIELPVSDSTLPANRELFESWSTRLPRSVRQAPEVKKLDAPSIAFDRQPHTVVIEWNKPAQSVEWFPPPSDEINFTDVEVKSDGTKTTVRFKAQPLAGKKPAAQTLQSVLAYSVNGQRKGLLIPLHVGAAASRDAAAAAIVSNP